MDYIDGFKDKLKTVKINEWVIDNMPEQLRHILHAEDVKHITNGINQLIDDVVGHAVAGSFIQAILKNNLNNAVNNADETNILALPIYAKFVTDFVPIDIILSHSKTYKDNMITHVSHLTDNQLGEVVSKGHMDSESVFMVHLKNCPDCRERLEEMKDFYDSIDKHTEE